MGKFLIFIFSIICGAIGFLVSRFWFQPILRYIEIKGEIISNLIFYDNVIRAEGLSDEMKQRMNDRMVANRRHSADLAACYYRLPRLYRWYLMKKKERPDLASGEMMSLSNTMDLDSAHKRTDKIQELLRINPKVV